MTAFAASTDLPSSVNSLEKLGAWVGLALTRLNPTSRVLETPGLESERVAQCVLIRADDNSCRLVVRLSIPVADGYAENPAKFWNNALDISNTALPAAFRTN